MATKRERSLSLSDTDDEDRQLIASTPLQTMVCEWGNCDEAFYELEPLTAHLHAHLDALEPKKLICGWCQKNQSSKITLATHLRSHTGEKPYPCPRSDCDKSMTRLDALQKHLRSVHGDVIHIRAPNHNSTKKRKANRAGSVESDHSAHPPLPEDHAPIDDTAPTEIVWTENERIWAGKQEGCSIEFVGYVVEKAKFNYLLKEHEGMLAELELLMTSEAELGTECDELLGMIMRKELLQPDSTANTTEESKLVEEFLTKYHHPPLDLPQDRHDGTTANSSSGRLRRSISRT